MTAANRLVHFFSLLAACLLFSPVAADPAGGSKVGGDVEWARLKTQSPSWDRHSQSDSKLLYFIRNSTSLDIGAAWHAADVEDLQQMCAYPFLFSEGLHHVTDAAGLGNLREYIKRGGFIFIDACINPSINPDPDAFLQMQIATLQTILPDARVERLPSDHEIFRNCFEMKEGLPHSYMGRIYDPAWAKHGLYAVHSGGRFISLISLSGLQCGWDGNGSTPGHDVKCMKMLLNIYAYALTH